MTTARLGLGWIRPRIDRRDRRRRADPPVAEVRRCGSGHPGISRARGCHVGGSLRASFGAGTSTSAVGPVAMTSAGENRSLVAARASTSSAASSPAASVAPEDGETYDELLNAKATEIRRLFGHGADGGADSPVAASTIDDRSDARLEPVDRRRESLIPAERGLEIYPSPKTRGYRLRCRFAVARDGGEGSDGQYRYALFEKGEVRVLDVGGRGECETDASDAFPVASDAIAALMPPLLRRLNALASPGSAHGGAVDGREARGNRMLAANLSAVGFLANRDGDVVVTLWSSAVDGEGERKTNGGKKKESRDGDAGSRTVDATEDDDWDAAANALVRDLGIKGVIGRSRGRVRVASRGVDHVWETMTVCSYDGAGVEAGGRTQDAENKTDRAATPAPDGSQPRTLRYQQVEGAFSNPNGDVAEVTAQWLYDTVGEMRRMRVAFEGESNEDVRKGEAQVHSQRAARAPFPPLLPSLVELYSGNGNHTCCLAPHFREVTAVEIEPRLCAAAEENFAANGVENATCRALPAEVFARATQKRGRVRSEAGEEPDVLAHAGERGVVLVDPPRAGLDSDTLALVRRFRSVLYIACDARSLHRDLVDRGLAESHRVRRMALFDHFPFSKFCEVVVWLEAKE